MDAPACQRVLPHPLAVESVAFSPNGRFLVTGCIDRMLEFVRQNPQSVAQPVARQGGLVPNIGAA